MDSLYYPVLILKQSGQTDTCHPNRSFFVVVSLVKYKKLLLAMENVLLSDCVEYKYKLINYSIKDVVLK